MIEPRRYLNYLATWCFIVSCGNSGAISTGQNSKGPSESSVGGSAEVLQLQFSDTGINCREDVFGINTTILFTEFDPDTDDPSLIDRFRGANWRFPGGTLANFYHFRRPAYGFVLEDVEQCQGSEVRYLTTSYEKDQEVIRSRGLTQNHAVSMVEMAHRTNSPVTLVANILTSPPEEVLEMVDFFVENGVRIAGLELGNENYLLGNYGHIIDDVEDYIELITPVMELMDVRHPDIPLAVVLAPAADYKKTSAKRRLIFDDWNERLGELDGYDAVILHLYSYAKECLKIEDKEELCRCTDEFNQHYTDVTFERAIEGTKNRFPEKDIWVTEWNIFKVFGNTGNTLTQALHYAEFQLKLQSTPEVGLAIHHNLLSGAEGFNLIRKPNKGPMEEMASYKVVELLSRTTGPDVRMSTSMMDKDGVTSALFEDEEGRFMVIINHTTEELSVSSILSERAQMHSISAAKYSASNEEMTKDERQVELAAFLVPALSVSRIDLD